MFIWVNPCFYFFNCQTRELRLNQEVKREIRALSNYNEFGARKIAKIIKDKIENEIIEKVMEGKSEVYIRTIRNGTKV